MQQQLQGLAQFIEQRSYLQQYVQLKNAQAELEAKINRARLQQSQHQSECKDAKHAYHVAAQHANQAEMQWHNNQAALLAQSLEDHQPCPVCGALEHPKPAVMQEGVTEITKDVITHLRQAESDALETLNKDKLLIQHQQLLEDWQTSIAQQQQQLMTLNSQYQHGDLASDMQTANQQLAILNSQIQDLQKQQTELPRYEQAQQQMQQQLDPIAAVDQR